MAPVDRTAFVAALRELDPRELTAFVAALWEARGVGVEQVAQGALRLEDGRLVSVRPVGPTDADLVVALDGGDVDAVRLYQFALYAVDRDDLAALCEQYLNRPLDAFPTTDTTESTAATGTTAANGRPPSRSRRVTADTTPATDLDTDTAAFALHRLVVVVAVVAVVAVAVVGAAAPFSSDKPISLGTGSTPAPTTSTVTAAPVTTSTAATATEAAIATNVLPPGVDLSAIDERRLAAAHTTVLANRSYQLTLVYREFIDSEPSAVRRETVRVADGRYVATVRTAGEFRTTPVSFIDTDTYANQTVRVERTPDGVSAETRYDATPFVKDQARLVRYYLSVREARVTDTTTVAGHPGVWVVTVGDPWPGVSNATGSAAINRHGLVGELRRRYDDPDDPRVSVVVTMRITEVGTTSVEPPAWYRNATSDATVAGRHPSDDTMSELTDD